MQEQSVKNGPEQVGQLKVDGEDRPCRQSI